jgi:hypothetical protein
MKFAKNSAFKQQDDLHEASQRFIQESKRLAEKRVEPTEEKVEVPFKHWHHDLMTIEVLLGQSPPEIERARDLLLEVADEIHSQFESIGGRRNET